MYLFSNPRATWVLSKLQGLQYYFLENLDAILKVYESEDFILFLSPSHFRIRKF